MTICMTIQQHKRHIKVQASVEMLNIICLDFCIFDVFFIHQRLSVKRISKFCHLINFLKYFKRLSNFQILQKTTIFQKRLSKLISHFNAESLGTLSL
jgi:hypothetical protein